MPKQDERGRYEWADDELDRYRERFWAVPRRIVEDGTWAKLWRADNSTRGGGAATSVLPVLALHSWPRANEPWSKWTSMPMGKLAALAGLHRDTAAHGAAQLVRAKLCELQREAMTHGGYRTRYRLASALYARRNDKTDPFGRITGVHIYGGTWAMLPTSAARHLYVVICAMDPIGDEDAYCEHIEGGGVGPWCDDITDDDARDDYDAAEARAREVWLADERRRHPLSLTRLSALSGLPRRTITRTLPVLYSPVFGHPPTIALVRYCHPTDPQRGVAYSPDPRIHSNGWHWNAETLNDPVAMRQIRRWWMAS